MYLITRPIAASRLPYRTSWDGAHHADALQHASCSWEQEEHRQDARNSVYCHSVAPYHILPDRKIYGHSVSSLHLLHDYFDRRSQGSHLDRLLKAANLWYMNRLRSCGLSTTRITCQCHHKPVPFIPFHAAGDSANS